MRRRDFITLLGGAAAWPLAARAQQVSKSHRIEIAHPTAWSAERSQAFFKELRLFGYVEGQNLIVERRSGAGREDRFDELARRASRMRT